MKLLLLCLLTIIVDTVLFVFACKANQSNEYFTWLVTAGLIIGAWNVWILHRLYQEICDEVDDLE